MKFLRIEKSLTSAENVVLTIVNRREGATLLNVDECHSVEVRAADLMTVPEIPKGAILVDEMSLPEEHDIVEFEMPDEPTINYGTLQGL